MAICEAEVAASTQKSRQSVRCYCAFGASRVAEVDRGSTEPPEQDVPLELLAQSSVAQDGSVDPLALLLGHERTSACEEAHNEAMATVLDLARLLGKIVADRHVDDSASAGSADAA